MPSGFGIGVEQVNAQLLSWLSQGLRKIKDLDEIAIGVPQFVSLPFARARCDYEVRWQAQIVQFDKARYSAAEQRYDAAYAQYRIAKDNFKQQHRDDLLGVPTTPFQAPKSPDASDYKLFFEREGLHSGAHMSAFTPQWCDSEFAAHRSESDWALQICMDGLKNLADRLPVDDYGDSDGGDVGGINVLRRTDDSSLIDGLMRNLERALPKEIEASQKKDDKQILELKHIRIPPLSSSEAYKFVVIDKVRYPVVFVSYKRGGESFSCVMDGILPDVIKGKKAQRGFGEMAKSLWGALRR